MLAVNDTFYTINFLLTHKSFAIDIILLSVLFFIGQLFYYRVITKMRSNIPAYLSTSRKVLNIQVSMAFSVHTYHPYQVIGMIFSWIFIVIQAFSIIAVKDKNDDKN